MELECKKIVNQYINHLTHNVEYTEFSRCMFFNYACVDMYFYNVVFSNCVFYRYCFEEVALKHCEFHNCKFIQCGFSGTTWENVRLTNLVGLGSKKSEQAFARSLLKILSNPKNKLDMREWHTCETTHCIAGWAFPNEKYPAEKASTAYPTLAQYFYTDNDTAMEAIKRVAIGVESIWN
jgi:hypothetical protein